MTDFVPAILTTGEHLIRCNIQSDGTRLLDVLNDTGSKYLRVTDVRVFQRTGNHEVDRVSEAILAKSSLSLAIPASKRHEAPEKRVIAYTNKREREAFLLVDYYAIRGNIQLQGTNDPVSLLTLEACQFIPIPNGRITDSALGELDSVAPVVIVNRDRIALIQLAEQNDPASDLRSAIRDLVGDLTVETDAPTPTPET